MLEMVLGQPQSVVAQFVHDLGDRLGLVKHRGELVVGIAPVVGRGCVLTVVGDVDVTGIDRHEFVDHLCSSPGKASRRYCPETRGKRAPIPGAPRIGTIFPPGGPEEVCSQSDPLGGTEGSNLSPSSGESCRTSAGCQESGAQLYGPARSGSDAIYSMTRSARCSSEFGIWMPICSAAFRLPPRSEIPRGSSMGFVSESQVRTRLPAGGKRIRTRGPSSQGRRHLFADEKGRRSIAMAV